MVATVTPSQTRYNDPYQQTVFQFNTADSKLYLSRESNKLLNVIGNDLVLEGLTLSNPMIVSSSTVRTVVAVGWAIIDNTLVQIAATSTVDQDVAALDDTSTSGAHLGVFLNYQYLESVGPNRVSVDIYHISSGGSVYNPFGRFATGTCRILLGIIDFTKSGSTVTSASLNNNLSYLLVEGTNMYVRGYSTTNVKLANLFAIAFNEHREYLLKRDFLWME